MSENYVVQPNGSKWRDSVQIKETIYVDKCWDTQLNTDVGNGISPTKIDTEEGTLVVEE